jgi:HTH-type transcriptional regulator, sugar sensing transcriptional regulator
VLETLASLGLKPSDANVYVFLAKKGPHTGKDLCNALNMPKPCLYQCLKNLESKGIINATSERPALFSAVPFEKVLDILVKVKLEEAERTQQEKDEAIFQWQSLFEEDLK